MPAVRAGEVTIHRVADLPVSAIDAHWLAAGMSTLMIWGVSVSERMMAAVVVLWDSAHSPPDGQRRHAMTEMATRRGAQIAAVLDLCASEAAVATIR
jgi:hypothetical protein